MKYHAIIFIAVYFNMSWNGTVQIAITNCEVQCDAFTFSMLFWWHFLALSGISWHSFSLLSITVSSLFMVWFNVSRFLNKCSRERPDGIKQPMHHTFPSNLFLKESVLLGFWSLYCGVCIYLGINRCGDLYGGRFMVVMFSIFWRQINFSCILKWQEGKHALKHIHVNRRKLH